MQRAFFLAFAAIVGCTGDANSDGINTDTGVDVTMTTFVGTTSLDGEPVDGTVDVYAQKRLGPGICDDGVERNECFAIDLDTLVATGPSDSSLEVPANTPLYVAAGDVNAERACNLRGNVEEVFDGTPLQQVNGNTYTYEAMQYKMTEGENPTVDVPLALYLLGWYECTEETWVYNDETKAYDFYTGVTSFDPIIVRMDGERILPECSGSCMSNLGSAQGVWSVKGSTLVLTTENGAIESLVPGTSWLTPTDMSFTLLVFEENRQNIVCTMTKAATCDE